jgi:hypothetical protein
MVDQVVKIGTGGRLYADSRPEEGEEVNDAVPVEAEKPRKRPAWAAGIYEGADGTSEEPEPKPAKPNHVVKPMYEPPKPPRDWRPFFSSLLEVVGMIALTAAGFTLYPWLGLAILAVCLITTGIAIGLPQRNGSTE